MSGENPRERIVSLSGHWALTQCLGTDVPMQVEGRPYVVWATLTGNESVGTELNELSRAYPDVARLQWEDAVVSLAKIRLTRFHWAEIMRGKARRGGGNASPLDAEDASVTHAAVNNDSEGESEADQYPERSSEESEDKTVMQEGAYWGTVVIWFLNFVSLYSHNVRSSLVRVCNF